MVFNKQNTVLLVQGSNTTYSNKECTLSQLKMSIFCFNIYQQKISTPYVLHRCHAQKSCNNDCLYSAMHGTGQASNRKHKHYFRPTCPPFSPRMSALMEGCMNTDAELSRYVKYKEHLLLADCY